MPSFVQPQILTSLQDKGINQKTNPVIMGHVFDHTDLETLPAMPASPSQMEKIEEPGTPVKVSRPSTLPESDLENEIGKP